MNIKLQVNTIQRESSAEKRVREALENLDLAYIKEKRIGRYSIDFYLGQKLCIEVQGEYWHNIPERKETDKRKREYLESNGYHVLYLWENDLDNSERDILAFLKNLGRPTVRAVENNPVNPRQRGVRLKVKRRANGGR